MRDIAGVKIDDLCWERQPVEQGWLCDRMKHHLGLHSWEAVAKLEEVTAKYRKRQVDLNKLREAIDDHFTYLSETPHSRSRELQTESTLGEVLEKLRQWTE
jgi:hypothetical protein